MARTPPPDREAVHRAVQSAVLQALATAPDVEVIVAAANPGDKRVDLLAGAAVLELATSALELAVPTGGQSLHYDGLRQRYLPEIVFRGRVEHRNSQCALYAAACRRGGLDVDLVSDTSWWGAPLWIYTTYALIIYARAASDATSTNLAAIADTLEQRHIRTAT